MHFSDILRELLEERDISQKKLANDLKIAASTLGNYIRDHREPDFETLKRIAAYFQVSVDHLLQLYRSLTPVHQRIYLEQGKAFLKYSGDSTT